MLTDDRLLIGFDGKEELLFDTSDERDETEEIGKPPADDELTGADELSDNDEDELVELDSLLDIDDEDDTTEELVVLGGGLLVPLLSSVPAPPQATNKVATYKCTAHAKKNLQFIMTPIGNIRGAKRQPAH